MASLSAQTKNYDAAKNLYEKAVAIQPNNVSAHNNLGAISLQLGDPRGALISFQNAEEINPNDMNAKNNLAVLLRSTDLRQMNLKNKDHSYLKSLLLILFRRNDIDHTDIFKFAKFVIFAEKKYSQYFDKTNLSIPLLKNSTIQDLLSEELFLLMLQKNTNMQDEVKS